MTVDLRLFSLINAQDNFSPFPEIFFVQILRIILWRFRLQNLTCQILIEILKFFFEQTQIRWTALQPTVLLWSLYALVDILSANQKCRLLRPIFGVVCRFAGGFPHCFLPLSSSPHFPHLFPFRPRCSYPGYQRFNFLACGGNFRYRPKVDTSSALGRSHCKDLTETGNRARKLCHPVYGLAFARLNLRTTKEKKTPKNGQLRRA